jgi:kynureninase
MNSSITRIQIKHNLRIKIQQNECYEIINEETNLIMLTNIKLKTCFFREIIKKTK